MSSGQNPPPTLLGVDAVNTAPSGRTWYTRDTSNPNTIVYYDRYVVRKTAVAEIGMVFHTLSPIRGGKFAVTATGRTGIATPSNSLLTIHWFHGIGFSNGCRIVAVSDAVEPLLVATRRPDHHSLIVETSETARGGINHQQFEQNGGPYPYAVSGNGRWLAYALLDHGKVAIELQGYDEWDHTFHRVSTLTCPGTPANAIHALCFSEDGSYLFGYLGDSSVRCWDMPTGTMQAWRHDTTTDTVKLLSVTIQPANGHQAILIHEILDRNRLRVSFASSRGIERVTYHQAEGEEPRFIPAGDFSHGAIITGTTATLVKI